jgi:hypothetical protein
MAGREARCLVTLWSAARSLEEVLVGSYAAGADRAVLGDPVLLVVRLVLSGRLGQVAPPDPILPLEPFAPRGYQQHSL